MRWSTFAIFAYAALALEVGLRTLLGDPFGIGLGQPSFALVLMVFVSMAAWPMQATIAAGVLGLLVDLVTDYTFSGSPGSAAIVGPQVLGYLVGCYAVLQVRAMVFRGSRGSMIFMTFMAGMFVNLVVVALLEMRRWGWLPSTPLAHWSAADELMGRFLSLLYTAVLAYPLGVVLHRTDALWGFTQSHWSRRSG